MPRSMGIALGVEVPAGEVRGRPQAVWRRRVLGAAATRATRNNPQCQALLRRTVVPS